MGCADPSLQQRTGVRPALAERAGANGASAVALACCARFLGATCFTRLLLFLSAAAAHLRGVAAVESTHVRSPLAWPPPDTDESSGRRVSASATQARHFLPRQAEATRTARFAGWSVAFAPRMHARKRPGFAGIDGSLASTRRRRARATPRISARGSVVQRTFAVADLETIPAVDGLDVEDVASGHAQHALDRCRHVLVHAVRKLDHHHRPLARGPNEPTGDGSGTTPELAEYDLHESDSSNRKAGAHPITGPASDFCLTLEPFLRALRPGLRGAEMAASGAASPTVRAMRRRAHRAGRNMRAGPRGPAAAP